MSNRRVGALLFLSGFAACKPVTWAEDVQPLLAERCLNCHQVGGIAPNALDTYEVARVQAKAMVMAATERRMPPIPATADGSCQRFTDARWLSADELAVLQHWLDQGTPRGSSVAPRPVPSTGHVSANALTLTMPTAYTPVPLQGSDDRYRCFVLDPHLLTSSYVVAAEFLPGDAQQVHHVALFAVDPQRSLGAFTNAAGIASMEADDPEPGWECYGTPGQAVQPRSQLPSWFGGVPLVKVPDGYGMPLRAGEWVVMQVHYRAKATPAADQTTLKLELAPQVERPLIAIFRDPVTFAMGTPPKLLPGQAEARFEWTLPASDIEAELRAQGVSGGHGFALVGAAAHMHELGVGYRLSMTPMNASATCGLDIRAWDFHWQRSYFYERPLDVPQPETAVHVECTYDTRSVATPVFAGHDKGREMCSLVAYVAALP